MKINNTLKYLILSAVVMVCIFSVFSYAKANTTQCSDGIDNDGDGEIDALVNFNQDNGETFYFNNAWDIRSFINNYHQRTVIKDTEPNSGALLSDTHQANYVCNLKGYEKASPDFTTDYYRSCHNNTIVYYDYDASKYATINACKYNKYLWSVTCINRLSQCNDWIDNDKDGKIDMADNGCASSNDNSETPHDSNCSNLQDNTEKEEIACSSASDCGTSGYIGDPFCQGNTVYKNYKTYTCNNPGTASSTCTNSTAAQLQNTCTANQTCSSGQCQNVNIACSSASDCGTSGYIGDQFCKSGDVYKTYRTYTCSNPGTANSTCSSSTDDRLTADCTANQTCSSGSCVNQNNLVVSCYANPNPSKTNQTVSFIASAMGGTGSYTYSWSGACTGSSQVCSQLFPQTGTYNAVLNVVSGGQNSDVLCSVVVNQNCSSHYSKRCLGNDVYWYDSCGNQEGIFQDCTTNQTCTNGQCANINIPCNTNAQCGTNGYTGLSFCQNGNVYQNYKTYICNNPGTASSTCSNSTELKSKETCSLGKTCSNGVCVNIACSSTSDCGTSGFIGDQFCKSGDVYKTYRTYTCSNPGTANSTCSSSTDDRLTADCTANQTCASGQCQNLNIACSSASDCGANGFIGDPFCKSGDVYKTYRTYTCSNPGTANSTCSSSTDDRLTADCTANQTCSSGSCQNNCTNHSFQRCSGNNLYWYDSCGTQQELIQYCPSGCYNNSCNQQNTGNLIVNKTAKNMSSINSSWSNTIYASPSDMLMFMITIQATGNQGVNNIFVRDTLPVNLIYKNQLIISGANYNYSGDITSGINLGAISAGQTITITYRAQIAPAQNFSYGSTTLNNNVNVTSSGYNYNPVGNATIIVTRSAVYGATIINTGLTGNFLADSFLPPLMIALAGIWMLRSGMFFKVEKLVDLRKAMRRDYKAQKELRTKIAQIKQREGII